MKNRILRNRYFKADIIERNHTDKWLTDFQKSYDDAKLTAYVQNTISLLQMDSKEKTELYKLLKKLNKK